MRADLDTFPTPGLLGYWPTDLICNRNAATTHFRWQRSKEKNSLRIFLLQIILHWCLIQQFTSKEEEVSNSDIV